MVISSSTFITAEDRSKCPECGNKYKRLATHFSHSPTHRPELSELQLGVIEYLILRGVTISDRAAYPSIDVTTTDKELLQAYSDLLGWVSNPVRLYQCSETISERLNDRLGGDVTAEDCNDVYALSTIPHPEFENYTEGSTSVESLSNDCLKATVITAGTFVGKLFGSLHIDLRGWDVDSDRFDDMLAERGYDTVSYDGDGYASDGHTHRYHYSDEVLCIPHYDAMNLLDEIDLPLKTVAEPI
ncbi:MULTISPECIES: hypothetical protein [unclassified Haloarcula]|uniref:hypothetical protein n=1 Tax=unclassified Haloarcula TaxID=2624677 RepID=UPI00124738BC|nr:MULTISPECIES: hypothetical protein [unclassified Haloarcula]